MKIVLALIAALFVCAPAKAQYATAAVPVAPMATSNLQFYVSPTGSGSSCTSASPCTFQQAIVLAASYNWNYSYCPTINVATGSYSNVQVILPALLNCNAGGTINFASGGVTVSDGGTGWTFTSASYSNWTFSGSTLTLGGSYGGLYLNEYSFLTVGNLTFSGSLVNGGFNNEEGTLNANGASVAITTSSMGPLLFTRGISVFDNSTITFANSVTFVVPAWGSGAGCVMCADNAGSVIDFIGGNFINGSNVHATVPLGLYDAAFFEANTTTKVDGVVLSRSNFPGVTNGGTVFVDASSLFQSDNANGTSILGRWTGAGVSNAILLNDANGNAWADFNSKFSGAWSFYSSYGQVLMWSGSVSGQVNLTFVSSSDSTDIPWVGLQPGNSSAHVRMGGYISGNTPFDFDVATGVFTLGISSGGTVNTNGGTLTIEANSNKGLSLASTGAATIYNLPTSTESGYLCAGSGATGTSGGAIGYDTLTCGSSTGRFKVATTELSDSQALQAFGALPDVVRGWRYNGMDMPNDREHVGLYAEDIERLDRRCIVYDKDGKVKNYEDRCVIAYLVAAMKAQQQEISELRARSR